MSTILYRAYDAARFLRGSMHVELRKVMGDEQSLIT